MNKDIKNNWKNIWLEMSDVFWINLHSIPWNNKKYPPKPNLYSYFWALAYYLAKEWWKVSYIVPEWFTAYDCNSYYLLNKVNLQKLYFFNTKVFTDRWINWKMDVATSAIIFKYTKEQKQDNLCITSYKSKGEKEELKKVLYFMKVEGNKKYISKDLAKEYISNWLSILKQNKQILEFLKFYKQNTDSLAIYYEHSNPNKPVKDNFYFDIWYILEDKYIINDNNDWYLLFIKWSDLNKFYIEDTWKYYPSYEDYIKLTKNSQWYSLLNNKYYLAISIKNWDIFTFFDKKIIFNMWSASCIWSNNKLEMLYLFSILNSYIAKFIKKIFTIEWEKDFLFSLTFLKGQIRVPKIDSQIKKELKEKLIKNWEKIINYVKNKSSVKKKYKDIFETEPDLISLWEKITWIKEEYKNLEEKIKEIEGVKELSKLNNKLEDNLPEEILKLLPNELEKFEEERDLIVYCLYFGSENWNDEYINLSEIDVNNILKYKEKISNNKWVKVIYWEGKSENDIKKMK